MIDTHIHFINLLMVISVIVYLLVVTSVAFLVICNKAEKFRGQKLMYSCLLQTLAKPQQQSWNTHCSDNPWGHDINMIKGTEQLAVWELQFSPVSVFMFTVFNFLFTILKIRILFFLSIRIWDGELIMYSWTWWPKLQAYDVLIPQLWQSLMLVHIFSTGIHFIVS